MARNFISLLSIQFIMQISHSKPIKHLKIAPAKTNTPRVFAGLRRVSWVYLQFAARGSLCETESRTVRALRTVRGSCEQKPFVRLVADLSETPPLVALNQYIGLGETKQSLKARIGQHLRPSSTDASWTIIEY